MYTIEEYDREKTNATTDIKENIFIKASANQKDRWKKWVKIIILESI